MTPWLRKKVLKYLEAKGFDQQFLTLWLKQLIGTQELGFKEHWSWQQEALNLSSRQGQPGLYLEMGWKIPVELCWMG